MCYCTTDKADEKKYAKRDRAFDVSLEDFV